MKIDVKELKNLLTKATLNNSIETVQLNFTEDNKIVSNMITASRDAIVLLKIDNNVISDITEETELNFRDTNTNIMPFLNLLDKDEANMKIMDEKVVISSGRQRLNLFFCASQVVSKFEGDADGDIEPFYKGALDENFIDGFSKIKKVGARFGFVYFTVNNGKLSIETTDKSNKLSNGLSLELCDIKADNCTLCFNYKNFSNLISIINGDYEDFTLDLYYVESHNAGMLKMTSEDASETYYLMSIIEEEMEK